MSRQELVEEMRDSEGNPETRSRRRQRAEEIASNRMMADVPKADVVILPHDARVKTFQSKRSSSSYSWRASKWVNSMEKPAEQKLKRSRIRIKIHSRADQCQAAPDTGRHEFQRYLPKGKHAAVIMETLLDGPSCAGR